MSIISPQLDSPIREADCRRAFAVLVQEGADALMLSTTPEIHAHRRLIVELAEKGWLPAIYGWRTVVEVGGFMAYVPDSAEIWRHAANQIDQILRGTKPGDIPYELPTKFELFINLKTANALGLTIPPSLVARADEVIE
jgi:putative ABC transport system substrate-binding protein